MCSRSPRYARVACQLRLLSAVTDVMTHRAINDTSSERLSSDYSSDNSAGSVAPRDDVVVQ